MSPTMFSILIDTLLDELNACQNSLTLDGKNVNVLAFADDVVLIANSEHELTILLNCLEKWCQRWKIVVNLDKTKIVVFSPGKLKVPRVQMKYNDVYVEQVQQYRYLGVVLDEKLTLDSRVRNVKIQAMKALGLIISKFNPISKPQYKSYEKLVQSIVISTIRYSIGVLPLKRKHILQLDQVISRAQRYFCNLPKRTACLGIENLYGWLKCNGLMILEMTRFYNRCLRQSEDRLH